VIYALPISILTIPFLTTLFSKFSYSSVFNEKEIIRTFNSSWKINNFLMVPITFILFFGGDMLLKIFYQRGAFNTNSTLITFNTLKYYLLSLVFYSSYLILVKLYYSKGMYKEIMIFSVAAAVIKIIMNIVLVSGLLQNGLALSTSIVYLFLFLVSLLYLFNKGILLNKRFYMLSFIIFVLNGLISLIFVKIIMQSITGNDLIVFLINSILFIIIYSINSYLLGDSELNYFFNIVKKLDFREMS